MPTRVNSPADNEIENRDSAVGDLFFSRLLIAPTFTAQNSVSSPDKIKLKSGGNGSVTGEEVRFDVLFRNTLDLPAGAYFFVPKIGLKNDAPAGSDFLWLSAPKPIQPPGTPFTPDRQSWMRFDPGLAPDWLRIGTDIIGGATFNGSFSLFGHTVPDSLTRTGPDSAAPDSHTNGLPPALVDSPLATPSFAGPLATPPSDGADSQPLDGRNAANPDNSASVNHARDLHNVLLSGAASSHTHQDDSAFTDWSDGFLPARA